MPPVLAVRALLRRLTAGIKKTPGQAGGKIYAPGWADAFAGECAPIRRGGWLVGNTLVAFTTPARCRDRQKAANQLAEIVPMPTILYVKAV